MEAVAITRRLAKGEIRQPFEEDRQDRRELQARQGRADAKMNAAAKGDVRVRRARWVDSIGIDEALGIAIGRAEHQADLLAFPERDALVGEVLQRVAGE